MEGKKQGRKFKEKRKKCWKERRREERTGGNKEGDT